MTGSPTLVAEIGCNHGGYLDTALRQAELAVESGADVVKFQTFKPEAVLTARLARLPAVADLEGVSGAAFAATRPAG